MIRECPKCGNLASEFAMECSECGYVFDDKEKEENNWDDEYFFDDEEKEEEFFDYSLNEYANEEDEDFL